MKTFTSEISAIRNTDEDYLFSVESLLKGGLNAKAVMLEMLVHQLFDKYVIGLPESHRQSWDLMELSNGGFYLCPSDDRAFTIKIRNFSITMDNHQLGMALTLDVLSSILNLTRDMAYQHSTSALQAYCEEAETRHQADGIIAYLKLVKQL